MRCMHVMIGLASLLGAVLVGGPASALTAYSPTGHLNVRSGPGFQYPVVNQIQANVPAEVTGCVSDYSWCAVALPDGTTGWASSPYLVTKAAGTPKNLSVVGAQLGIPVVVPTGIGSVVATPPVGAMVPVAPTVGVIQPVPAPPNVVSYVTMQPVQPIIVNGEVMVGATLPAAVPLFPIPSSPYVYSYVNGQRILVEPTARRIVYVIR